MNVASAGASSRSISCFWIIYYINNNSVSSTINHIRHSHLLLIGDLMTILKALGEPGVVSFVICLVKPSLVRMASLASSTSALRSTPSSHSRAASNGSPFTQSQLTFARSRLSAFGARVASPAASAAGFLPTCPGLLPADPGLPVMLLGLQPDSPPNSRC
jgi:hypothetical protein